MNPNRKWKALFIFAVILFCIYFLFGYPVFPTSVARMKDNFSKQIKLGLDLQGGTHLILQVQVQEAIAQETDTTVDRLTTLLRSKNIHYDEVRRVDDTHILVRNVDPAQLSQFRDIYNAQFATDWDMSAAAGDRNGYTWTLRTSAIARIQESTMTQSLETDRKSTRLNSSHDQISYAVFCLKKKKKKEPLTQTKTKPLLKSHSEPALHGSLVYRTPHPHSRQHCSDHRYYVHTRTTALRQTA